jgi:glycerophosphoryl diester phosphodiesterase
VFAHRGSSASLPEHTIEAYERAIEEGVDGFECDVRLSRDGHLVCIHDASINRTSNGRGRVSALTLAELSSHDYSAWHPGAPEGRAPGILTLDRLLTAARAVDRPMQVLVETKHPARFGGLVEQQLVALLARHGLHTEAGARAAGVTVKVMSFSPAALRRVRALAPQVQTVFLFELGPPSIWEGRAAAWADHLGPGIKAVRTRPEVVRRAHERGHGVFVWTVNEASDIGLVVDLGVDGIISDRPAQVLATLGRSV